MVPDDFEPPFNDWPPAIACERYGLAYDADTGEYTAPGRESRRGW